MTEPQPRTLAALLQELPGARLVRGEPASAVSGVEHDSRRVTAGSLFVAIPGFTVERDGTQHGTTFFYHVLS